MISSLVLLYKYLLLLQTQNEPNFISFKPHEPHEPHEPHKPYEPHKVPLGHMVGLGGKLLWWSEEGHGVLSWGKSFTL